MTLNNLNIHTNQDRHKGLSYFDAQNPKAVYVFKALSFMSDDDRNGYFEDYFILNSTLCSFMSSFYVFIN